MNFLKNVPSSEHVPLKKKEHMRKMETEHLEA